MRVAENEDVSLIIDRILYVHYPLEVSSKVLEYVKRAAKVGGKEVIVLLVVEPLLPPRIDKQKSEGDAEGSRGSR